MSYISIDLDEKVGYEVNTRGRKVLNFFLIPFLNSLPGSSSSILKKTHRSADDIIKHATTHKALEVLYGHSTAKASGNLIQKVFKSVWLSTNNSKAVRNRLRLVKRELEKKLKELSQAKSPIRIASIASGSSRAVVESIDSIHFDSDPNLEVIFVDKNHDAIEYSKELAKDHKYFAHFKWINDTAGNFFRNHVTENNFNIIEMVGLMDYFDDQKAVYIFSKIYESLGPDGILITANIADNSERPFVTKAVGWKMIYRSADEFSNLLKLAGFSDSKMSVFYEPLKIHTVIVAKK